MREWVALTGATGFIGSVLRRRLRQAGVPVRALTRRPQAAEPGVEWVQGSLHDRAALDRLVRDAPWVIHCAGAVRGASAEAFLRDNAQGSLAVLEAAQASGACRGFLLMSSLAARLPQLSWYAASKHEAERLVREAAGSLPVTVFRPTAVYGPGDHELRPLFDWLLRGWLLRLGDPDARLTFIHVDDLAEAVLRWQQAPATASAVFELHDGTPDGYDWQALAAIGEAVRRRPVHQLSVPAALLGSLAHLNLQAARLLRRAPMLTPAKLNELRQPDWRCSNDAIERAFGWRPAISLHAALQRHCF